MCHNFFACSPVDGHLGCLHVLFPSVLVAVGPFDLVLREPPWLLWLSQRRTLGLDPTHFLRASWGTRLCLRPHIPHFTVFSHPTTRQEALLFSQFRDEEAEAQEVQAQGHSWSESEVGSHPFTPDSQPNPAARDGPRWVLVVCFPFCPPPSVHFLWVLVIGIAPFGLLCPLVSGQTHQREAVQAIKMGWRGTGDFIPPLRPLSWQAPLSPAWAPHASPLVTPSSAHST